MEKALGLGLLFAGGALTLKAMANKKRRSPGSFNIEWANQENQIVGQWLLTTPQGGAVLKQAQNPTQLEELVRIAHVTDPIPNLEPEGDYDVTFDDLWNTVMGV